MEAELKAAEIAAEWQAAVSDVGIPHERVCVHVFEGSSNARGEGALWAMPGRNVPRKSVPFIGDNDGFRRFNTEQRDLHRVVVWSDQQPVLLAAKMRHELEHARQFEAHGPALFGLYDLVNAALDLKVAGLMGGGHVYSSIPTEVDANAAAARFVSGRHAVDAARLLEERHEASNLLRSLTGPGPLKTLPGRMVAFAYEYADLGERYFRERSFAMTFAATVDQTWPGALQAWSAIDGVNEPNEPIP